jgi:hypothetical protein
MGEARDLEKLAAAAPDFDIIIDDASHAFYHQQLAFRVLFPRLADGGLYIIEDPHWQPPFEGDLPPVPRTGELLSRYFENLEYLTGPVLPETFLRDAAADIGSFSLFPAFAGHPFPMKLIVLRKRKARSDPPPAKTFSDRSELADRSELQYDGRIAAEVAVALATMPYHEIPFGRILLTTARESGGVLSQDSRDGSSRIAC